MQRKTLRHQRIDFVSSRSSCKSAPPRDRCMRYVQPMTSFARRVWIALISCCALKTTLPCQQAFPLGSHRMVLQTPGGELPFGLTLAIDDGDKLTAYVHNGDERIRVPDAMLASQLRLRFPHYDSELTLTVDTARKTLQGEWHKRRGTGKATRMQVRSGATGARFLMPGVGDATPPWPFGRYRVAFAKSSDPAVGIFATSNDPLCNCRGTFLTTLGDYRYLAGMSDGRSMKLSCFDGAHAFLFHGERQPDGTIHGEFWSSDSWREQWTASPDPKAELADGWNLTKWRKGAALDHTKLRDLDGKPVSLTQPPFAGKPLVLEVFGSWCPNCHDHGAYMAELHNRYATRGLQVVGLAFEHDVDFTRSAKQVRAFAERHQAKFPILIAGLSDKIKATKSLAVLDQVRSFPTTIFIDHRGQVCGIYQGWSGPATGDAHRRLRQRFEARIESMLSKR